MYIPWTGFSPRSEQPKKIMRMSKHVHSEGCMTQCPEPHSRRHTFDFHHIGQHEKKPSLLARLFRSKSDDTMKVGGSPQTSPKSSPKSSPAAAPRRRFLRVVRDDKAQGEEFVNPHVIRRYNQQYWEDKHISKSKSLDEGRSSSSSPPKERLPYSVSGHTILKKYHSMDDTSVVSCGKHATFKEEVEVVRFDMKSKCVVIQDANVCHERLHDDTEVSYGLCVRAEMIGIDHPGCSDLMAEIDYDIDETLTSLEVISETDEKMRSPSDECVDFIAPEATDSETQEDNTETDQSLDIMHNFHEQDPEVKDTHIINEKTSQVNSVASPTLPEEIVDRAP